MTDAESLDNYFPQKALVEVHASRHAIDQKQEIGDCFSRPESHGFSEEFLYLSKHLHERLEAIRADDLSKSAIVCVPIPDAGTIPTILNNVFNIEVVSQMIGSALGTGEQPTPEVDIPIDEDHAFFEEEIAAHDEVGEDNRQEIRATGVLEFFDLVPDWLANNLDASIVPFEDRWLATLDMNLRSTGYIIVSPAPIGMKLDPSTNHRIIVTSFMQGTVNTNDGVPYPMEVELDYDSFLGVLDDEIAIPGGGEKTILAINEIYDSGDTVEEQIESLRSASLEQESFMDIVAAEIIPDSGDDDEFEAVEDDELMEVELILSGHRKDQIDLVLEQQIVVYVDQNHLEYAKAQLSENLLFLVGNVSLSIGLYNPGVPPEHIENTEENDYLQFYLNIKEANGKALIDSIVLHGGSLLALAKLKLPNHLPKRKPPLY